MPTTCSYCHLCPMLQHVRPLFMSGLLDLPIFRQGQARNPMLYELTPNSSVA